MKNFKKLIKYTALASLVMGVFSATSAIAADIAILMPTQHMERWNSDGKYIKSLVEKAGHTALLEYADDDVAKQQKQIKESINKNADVLIIGAVDGSSLVEALEGAIEKDIPVISFDRLIMNTKAISYYVTYNNSIVGRLLGGYVVDKFGFTDPKEGSDVKHIEIFSGPTTDNNVNYFYAGAMYKLNPYIFANRIKVLSNQISLEDTAIKAWSGENAYKRMKKLIAEQNYGPNGTRLDAVIAMNDPMARAIVKALFEAGYTKDNLPIVTGQDCEVESVRSIAQDYQTMSIFKNTKHEAEHAVDIAIALAEGKTPEFNDHRTYNNNTGVMRSYVLEPIAVDKDNMDKELFETKIYNKAEVLKDLNI